METNKITIEVSERYAVLARIQKHITEAMSDAIFIKGEEESATLNYLSEALMCVAMDMVEESPKELVK